MKRGAFMRPGETFEGSSLTIAVSCIVLGPISIIGRRASLSSASTWVCCSRLSGIPVQADRPRHSSDGAILRSGDQQTPPSRVGPRPQKCTDQIRDFTSILTHQKIFPDHGLESRGAGGGCDHWDAERHGLKNFILNANLYRHRTDGYGCTADPWTNVGNMPGHFDQRIVRQSTIT